MKWNCQFCDAYFCGNSQVNGWLCNLGVEHVRQMHKKITLGMWDFGNISVNLIGGI
jgi:hypothetical protein